MGFSRVLEKLYQFCFDQGNGKKNWMELEMKITRIKIKGIEDHNTVAITK